MALNFKLSQLFGVNTDSGDDDNADLRRSQALASLSDSEIQSSKFNDSEFKDLETIAPDEDAGIGEVVG